MYFLPLFAFLTFVFSSLSGVPTQQTFKWCVLETSPISARVFNHECMDNVNVPQG